MLSITKKQNTDQNLRTQFCARIFYNKAEKVSYTLWFFCIAEVVGSFFYNSIGEIFSIIYFATINIAIIICEIILKYYITTASSERKYFDYSVFDIKHSETFNTINVSKLKEISCRCEEKHEQLAKLSYQNNGEDDYKGVKDWYTDIPEDLSKNQKIIFCQNQNLYWDEKLSKINEVVLYILAIISVLLLFIFISNNNPFVNFLKVLMLLPLIWKVCCEIKNINESKKLNQVAKDIIKDNNQEIETVLEIQELIDRRREILFVTSNIIHKIKSIKYHRLFRKLNK